MNFGQFAASTQFYLFGKNHCTRTGWERAVLKYAKPDIVEESMRTLAGRVYLVTGANTGIGKEITTHLAKKGATVYMVCRNLEKAEKARQEIISKSNSPSVHVLQCDCSLESDVRKLWADFETAQKAIPATSTTEKKVRLDGIVCNAGALLNEKTLTSEGVEVRITLFNYYHSQLPAQMLFDDQVTFAAHLLYGTYLLGSLAMETLEATEDSRFIVVSRYSGGNNVTEFYTQLLIT